MFYLPTGNQNADGCLAEDDWWMEQPSNSLKDHMAHAQRHEQMYQTVLFRQYSNMLVEGHKNHSKLTYKICF